MTDLYMKYLLLEIKFKTSSSADQQLHRETEPKRENNQMITFKVSIIQTRSKNKPAAEVEIIKTHNASGFTAHFLSDKQPRLSD